MNKTEGHRLLRGKFEEMDDMWETISNIKNPQEADYLGEDYEEANINEEAFDESKPKHHHGHHHKPTKFESWFTRKNIYEMVAPKLWKYVCEGDECEEPTKAPQDVPAKAKGLGVCPIMVIIYIMMIVDLYLVKSLQKHYENLALFNRAKKILEEDSLCE